MEVYCFLIIILKYWLTEEERVSDSLLLWLRLVSPTVPPSPPSFTPVTLDHSEQQDLTYTPLRDDFEKVRERERVTYINFFLLLLPLFPLLFLKEYDNDAEKMISEVPLHYEEDSIERGMSHPFSHMTRSHMSFLDLKLAHIDMYNKKLKEREKRKR